MLTISSDLPKCIFRISDDKVTISYVSGFCLCFDYDFFIDNVEYVLTTPFMDALENKASYYLGRYPDFISL